MPPAQRIMTQADRFFFASEHSERIACGGGNHHQLDRILAHIDGRAFHAVFALSKASLMSCLMAGLSSTISGISALAPSLLIDMAEDSSSMARATERRRSA